MQSVELKHEGLEIKFYETTNEHAKICGFNASKPILFKHLLVDVNKRNRGNGKALLNMIQEYAEKNNFDLIFGHIPNDAEFTKDSRISFFSDIEMIKNMLFRNGYAINSDNNDFHKVLKIQKPLRFYGGIGFHKCLELGVYEIRTEFETKKFTKLSDAKLYYEKIKGEKAIWDLDNDELIDSWYYLVLKNI
jgi:GNAT superfamily N-acetyltransferase